MAFDLPNRFDIRTEEDFCLVPGQNLCREAAWPFFRSSHCLFPQSPSNGPVGRDAKAESSEKSKRSLTEEEIKANLRKTVGEHFQLVDQ